MDKKSIAIINGEDKYKDKLIKDFKGKKKIFGLNKNSDIYAESIIYKENSTIFNLICDKKIYKNVKIPFSGKHYLLDALSAIEVGFLLGVSIRKSIKCLNKIVLSSDRMNLQKYKNINILNDVYNSNPDSLKESINILARYKTRKILILGDMKELGINSKKYHYNIGKYLNNFNIDFLITIGEEAMYIAKGFLDFTKQNKDTKVYSFFNKEEAYIKIKKILLKNDTILIKGSRDMKMEDILNKIINK